MSLPNESIIITLNFLLNSDLTVLYKKVVIKKFIDEYINDEIKNDIKNIIKNNNIDIYNYVFSIKKKCDPEKLSKNYKKYYENNKEILKEKRRQYYQKHKEKEINRNKEYQLKKKELNNNYNDNSNNNIE